MTFPGAINLCTLTMGEVFDAGGDPGRISATVAVVLPTGLAHIVWTATGDQLRGAGQYAMADPGTDGTRLTADVPVVDQAGWATPGDAGNPAAPFTGWYYNVSGLVTWASGERQAFSIPVQPLTGAGTVDIDPLRQSDEAAVVSPGFTAPVSAVTSVVGHTGPVTGAQIAADPALLGTYAPLSNPTKDAPAFGLFFPEAHGALGGSNDDSTAVLAAVAAAQANPGGGTVLLAQMYRMNSALVIPYTGGTTPVQVPLRITASAGASANGTWPTNALNGGAGLDLRYAGAGGTSPAKIDTRGAGRIEIDHINIISGGSDNYPIFQTTNTTARLHDNFIQGNTANTGSGCLQDAIFFGGSSSTTVGNAAGAPFQGYGSKVHDNYFSHIRRGFVGRVFCNSIQVTGNTFSSTCGNSTGGAIEFHGDDGTLGGQFASGNSTRDNTIECVHYQYGIAAYYATMSNFGPDGFYDASSPYAAAIYIDGATAIYNTVVDGFRSDVYPLVIDSGRTTTVITGHQSQLSTFPQPQRFTSPIPNIAISSQQASIWATSPQGSTAAVRCNSGNHPYPEVALATQSAVQVADGVLNGTAVVTSATAAWQALDVGMPIQGTGIPVNTTILSRQSATQITMSANATATASGVTVTFGRGVGTGATDEIGVSRRHIITKGAIGTASISPGPAAGAGSTCAAVGTDTAFTLTLNTGTGTTSGDQCVVGAGINWAAAPKVLMTPKNAATALTMQTNQISIHNTTSNTFLNAGVALPASTTFVWDVIQIG